MKTIAYLRVSTSRQENMNQRYEIDKYCLKFGLEVDEYIEETVSGGKNARERKLWLIITELKEGDILIVRDISRIGRSLLSIIDVMQKCLENGIKIHVIDMNLILEDNLHSRIMASTLGMAAEIQRYLIRKNTKEALGRKRKEAEAKGERFKIGREPGTKMENRKLDAHMEIIQKMIKDNMSVLAMSRKLGVHRNTINNFILDRIDN